MTLPKRCFAVLIYCGFAIGHSACIQQDIADSSLSNAANAQVTNPIFDGWYADPEVAVIDGSYWIFPTFSTDFIDQLHFDAFSSTDLITWKKHPRILTKSDITWAKQAMWAPSLTQKDGRFFLFFAANDPQTPDRKWYDPNNDINHYGGIGIAVADAPEGPYEDYLGEPLISEFYNNAQPIDQFVYRDDDGSYYFFYGGWGVCNIGKLKADFTGFIPWEDGTLFKDITPSNYVEGSFVFKRGNHYYFLWSEGDWANDSYQVAYGISKSVTGPYQRQGVILSSDPGIATGAGHNSVLFRSNPVTEDDEAIIVYHRRPIPNKSPHHRVVALDRLHFNEDGSIAPVVMTKSFSITD